MQLNPNDTLHGFRVLTHGELREIDGEAVTGIHEKSGARLLYLKNDDNNKSFAIGFKTPPKDDTGVFHILEHSVLCGSRKFPVKEPFVDLLKGSMQTFLNAMTFADKTLYPVASTNEQDLRNLMDVYLDAVFHPRIYEKRAIFEQEGWHYELRAADTAGAAVGEGAAGAAGAAIGEGAAGEGAAGAAIGEGAAGEGAAGAAVDEGAAAGGRAAASGGVADAAAGGGMVEAGEAAADATSAGAAGAQLAELGADQTVLVHNGVVFNEMKGALSDSSSVLYDELQKALFPDTCYAFESGGTPEAIPTLTYEDYLDEHRRHYRTDNSYIILYGNLDIDSTLAFLDEEYLTPVADEQDRAAQERERAGAPALEPREISAQAPLQAGFTSTTMDTAPENAVAACGYVIGNASERLRGEACEILFDALLGSNEAPLKRALLDAGVAHDVNAYVSDALLQPFAIVQLNMPAPGVGARLSDIIADEVRALLERGLDKQLIEAALTHAEFVMREHDMGYADGVIYSMVALSSWLYDDAAATDYLRYEDLFAELREKLEGDYFERLCAELFLENGHTASVEVVPAPGDAQDGAAAKLAELNRTLGVDERRRIVEGEAVLRELQEAPDPPEASATLPRLGVADIGPAPDEPAYELDVKAPLPCIRHSVSTHGIAYAYRYFDMGRLSFEDLPYASILALVLGKLGTSEHTAAEIDTLSQGKLGNLSFYVNVYERYEDIDDVSPRFVASASALSMNAEWLAALPREVLTQTDFADTGKILDVLKQRKIGLEQAFANSGHTCAAKRCRSYYTKDGVLGEKLGNVGFYQFLCELIEDFDARAAGLAERLRSVAGRLFADDACLMSFAGSDEDYDRFWQAGPECGRAAADEAAVAVGEGARGAAPGGAAPGGAAGEKAGEDGDAAGAAAGGENDNAAGTAALGVVAAGAPYTAAGAMAGEHSAAAGEDEPGSSAGEIVFGLGRVPADEVVLEVPAPVKRNEAFVVPTDVCYAAAGWDHRLMGAAYSGSWMVAARALSLDYLWNEVRVKGGAYGVGFQAPRSGNVRFHSYRDPHLDETLARFERASEWLASYDPAPAEMEGYVVASVAGLDAPKKPREIVRRQANDYLSQRCANVRAEVRSQAVATTPEQLRSFAGIVKGALGEHAMCVFGNRDILEGSKAGFTLVNLVG